MNLIGQALFYVWVLLFFMKPLLAMEAKESVQFVGQKHLFSYIKNLAKTLNGQLKMVQSEDGHYFAIKISKLQRYSALVDDPVKELKILQSLQKSGVGNKEQIINIIDHGQFDNFIWIAMPLFNDGDAFEYLHRNKKLDLDEIRSLFADLALGVEYLHKNKIAHLDISLENCLLKKKPATGKLGLVLTDFGLAEPILDKPFSAVSKRPGKRIYKAPEIVAGLTGIHLDLADIWSMGVCLYMLETGFAFVEEASSSCLTYGYFSQDGLRKLLHCLKPYLAREIDEDLLDLLQNMLVILPNNRFSIEEVLKHPFLKPELGA